MIDMMFDNVDLGFIVNLQTLKEVLKALSVDGRRWWVASDPQDAAETGFITVGHGYPKCLDRLNTLHFLVPVIWNENSNVRPGRLALIIDPSVITQEEPCLYLEDGRLLEDPIGDFVSFYEPIKRLLMARLQAGI